MRKDEHNQIVGCFDETKMEWVVLIFAPEGGVRDEGI